MNMLIGGLPQARQSFQQSRQDQNTLMTASASNRPHGSDVQDRRIALAIRGVSMVFSRAGHFVHAVDNVSLDIKDGEFISVVGPSGCGKSTLLKLVTGLRAPTSGTIEIFGQPIGGPRKDVGIVFQNPVLLPWRTVLENVLLPVDVLKLDRATYREKASELLELVGLGAFQNAYPQELSGGMQQRAAIARALVYDAPILMMDEPFGALDAMTREQMNVEVQRIWEASRKTVIFVTHSIPEAVFLADRVVVMSPRPGRILATLEIELPRTRSLDDMLTPAFGEYVREIRGMLGSIMVSGEDPVTIIPIGEAHEAPLPLAVPPSASSLSELVNRFGIPIVVFIVVMASWEGLVRLAEIPGYILPAPSAVLVAFVNGFLSGAFLPDLAVTAFETVSGFLIGSLVGLVLGTTIVIFPLMERIIYPYVVALQTVPKVAIAPLFVVWFGFGFTSKIVVVALVSLFPVLVNVIAGLRSVEQERLDLLGALSASRWQVFWYLRFPNSLPFLFAGLNTAVVLAIIGAIVGEFVGANQGIGFRILQANYNLDIAGVFSLFIVLSMMGLVLHSALKAIERRTVFWSASNDIPH